MPAAGGVGIGVFTFHYDEFSLLFLAGRHLWHDDLLFLRGLADRLSVTLEVCETGSRKKAEADLTEMQAEGPVIAFLDLATLGHRGGVEAYYLVTVHAVDAEVGIARIADLANDLIEIPLATLADARARIRKFKNRLVRVADVPARLDLAAASRAGLQACIDGFEQPVMKGVNFRLDALAVLAVRMRGSGKDSWTEAFPPGPRLWTALASLYEYVEHYGTGGGLLRPLFAEALKEASERLGVDVTVAADAYEALGAAWSATAHAALPPDVPALAAMKQVIESSYVAYDASGLDAGDELQRLQEQRAELAAGDFPLSASDVRTRVAGLADRVDDLARGEREALPL